MTNFDTQCCVTVRVHLRQCMEVNTAL